MARVNCKSMKTYGIKESPVRRGTTGRKSRALDKYEYKIRSEEIKSLIAQKNYSKAAQIADTIDWRRVKNAMMLCTVSDLYKINKRYEDAIDLLLMAYDRHPGGRTICYSLCELYIKTGELVSAVNYYKEFVQAAPGDSGKYILLYKLYEAQSVSLEEQIQVLVELKKKDYREKWAYQLAYLYHLSGQATKCVEECDELILWFGEGKYVIKALELKMLYQQLTLLQQQKYDNRLGEKEDDRLEEASEETPEEIPEETSGETGEEDASEISYTAISLQEQEVQEPETAPEDETDRAEELPEGTEATEETEEPVEEAEGYEESAEVPEEAETPEEVKAPVEETEEDEESAEVPEETEEDEESAEVPEEIAAPAEMEEELSEEVEAPVEDIEGYEESAGASEEPDAVEEITDGAEVSEETAEENSAYEEVPEEIAEEAPEEIHAPEEITEEADAAQPQASPQRARFRNLTKEEKGLFGALLQNRGERERLVTALDQISMAAYTGNVIVTGTEGVDTVSMAENMIRDVAMTDGNFTGKSARISGAGLNQEEVGLILGKLKNGALIIKKASGMSRKTASDLYKGLQQETFGIIVVLEDTHRAMKRFLEANPFLEECFNARMDMEALSNEALVAFGRKYAREKEYVIDELGILALHTRIQDMQTSDHAVTILEVKSIIDEAIEKANKKTLKHLVDVIMSKRYDEEDMIILRENDFM